MGWELNLPQRGMHETCTVTVGCVTPLLSLSQHAILLLLLAGTVAEAAPGSCINQEGLKYITASLNVVTS